MYLNRDTAKTHPSQKSLEISGHRSARFVEWIDKIDAAVREIADVACCQTGPA